MTMSEALILYQTTTTAVKSNDTILFVVDHFGSTGVVRIKGGMIEIEALAGGPYTQILMGVDKTSSFKLVKGDYHQPAVGKTSEGT